MAKPAWSPSYPSLQLTTETPTREPLRIQWPAGEGAENVKATREYFITDQRNWTSGLHGGGRPVCEGTYTPDEDEA